MKDDMAVFAAPIVGVALMFGIFFIGHEKSETATAARGCYLRNMHAVISPSAVFCVENDTGIMRYYPARQPK